MVNCMFDIVKDFDELIELIKDSDIYKEYKCIEQQVSINEDIKLLTDEIKALQKEAVNAEYKNNYEKLKLSNEEIKNKYVELYKIPLYNDYIDKIDELNNLLGIIKSKFDSFIKELVL